MTYLRPRPEGHLPADMSVDFFLGLAFAVMVNGRVNERKLEEMLCMRRGTLAGIEAGIVELDKPTCVLLRLLHLRYAWFPPPDEIFTLLGLPSS